MIIRITKEYDRSDFREILNFHYRKLAEKVMTTVLSLEGCPFEAEVDITLVDDDAIRELNRDNRGIDRVTDVLSFPMVEYPEPALFDFAKENPFDAFNPENDHLMLGDIVLNIRRVKEQAEEYGHSTKREYAFLIAHSLLHLIGYDHMTADDAALMEGKQKNVLNLLKITRESAI